jgi:predicted metal-binding protein
MKEAIGTVILVFTCVVCLGAAIYFFVEQEDIKAMEQFNKYPECMTAHDPYLCVHLKNKVEKYNNDRQF